MLQYCLATDWTTGRTRFDPRQRQKFLTIPSVPSPAMGPTQPFVQWVPGVKGGRGVTLTTHPHLVPWLRMSRSYTYSPSAPPWLVVGLFYLYLHHASAPDLCSIRRDVSGLIFAQSNDILAHCTVS
jgi:hypothetical protein